MIFLLTILGILVAGLVSGIIYFLRHQKKLQAGALSAAAGVLLFGVLYFLDQYSGRHRVEAGLSLDLAIAGSKGHTVFMLPKGEYILVAEQQPSGIAEDWEGESATIRYGMSIPGQRLRVEEEREMDFSLGRKQIRMKPFRIDKNYMQGKLVAEVLRSAKGRMWLKVAANRYIDM